MTVRKGKFSIDNGPEYEGYTAGGTWNGWAKPVFTFDQSLIVLKGYGFTERKEPLTENTNKDEYYFDRKKDQFVITDQLNEELYEVPGRMVKTDQGSAIKVYSIFDGYCFDENSTDLKKMLILITFTPCKNPGYKVPFPEMKADKEIITEIRRDIFVASLDEYENMKESLPGYSFRRDAEFNLSVLVDDLKPAEIEKIKNSIEKNEILINDQLN